MGFANAKFEPAGLFHYVATDQFCFAWHKAPETGVFPTKLSDTSPIPPYLVTETYRALRTAYPGGDGSVAILRSMPPNNRVRWLSASISR